MPEPAPDDVHLDASLEEVNRRRVAEQVRADVSLGAIVVEVTGVASHDLVDAKV